MSLIRCPECASQISDRATTCPHCGVPMRAQARADGTSRPSLEGAITTQATGKTYKALQLSGAVVIAAAVASCGAAVPASGSWSGVVFLTGMVLYVAGCVRAWWNHG
jgi:hypothetical protein